MCVMCLLKRKLVNSKYQNSKTIRAKKVKKNKYDKIVRYPWKKSNILKTKSYKY